MLSVEPRCLPVLHEKQGDRDRFFSLVPPLSRLLMHPTCLESCCSLQREVIKAELSSELSKLFTEEPPALPWGVVLPPVVPLPFLYQLFGEGLNAICYFFLMASKDLELIPRGFL